MMRGAVMAAPATGPVCSVCAGAVERVADAPALRQVMATGAISGFCGSLFATFMLGRRR